MSSGLGWSELQARGFNEGYEFQTRARVSLRGLNCKLEISLRGLYIARGCYQISMELDSSNCTMTKKKKKKKNSMNRMLTYKTRG